MTSPQMDDIDEDFCCLCCGPEYNTFYSGIAPNASANSGDEMIEHDIAREEEETGERRFLRHEGEWLDDIRVIGVRQEDTIWYDKEPGNRLYARGRCSFVLKPEKERPVFDYVSFWGYKSRMKLHANCWTLLNRALDVIKMRDLWAGEVRLDAVVMTILTLYDWWGAMGGCMTTVDSGGAFQLMGSSWTGNVTSEAWYLTDFLKVPAINEYALNFPKAVPQEAGEGTRDAKRTCSVDNFNSQLNRLPLELLVQVLYFLPRKDVVNFRVASRTVAALPLTQGFWRSRFPMDSPWLWEFQDPELDNARVDWKRMYQDLVVKDVEPMEPKLRGLRNRKRVWEAVMGVASKCWDSELVERDKGEFVEDWADRFDALEDPEECQD
ncbi:hypothetical protein K440DRAFT_662131 [Wilcoxina mikolae CBS 423.85]|nr:hypothetical protein K440DRAFT_662131 [Wilcoxina mikolae CBS 423.85]